ncbi:IS30 family transposase [Halioxenophilus sp. WMMB6]|uniref:IS30 family transposase n=1 Tax=Halioxenophilus sp. WMMB6 TaxID=3073815 RepID=UPI00295F5616|nr:IS30 family transposase [Halioxenophilus sp. WMMB6]
MSYKHLTYSERTLIKDWMNKGHSYREIGRRLNRSHTTISREIKRNLWCGEHYYLRSAQEFYEARMKNRAQRFRLKTPQTRTYVIEKLNQGWSPEIISGRLREFDPENYVCHEAIYQFIYIETPELTETLARKHIQRRKKYPYRKPKERIKNRTPISLRPADVDSRESIGHWESDTIVGGDRKSGLNVIVERNTRLTNISFMPNKSAEQTKKSIIRRLANHPEHLVTSITYDNGSENVFHQDINEALNVQSYFCEPYHSWEKGSVEQVNGLIRRFFPKGTDFSSIPVSEINRVEKLLNNRPRKCLNYRTPYEVYREARGALTD